MLGFYIDHVLAVTLLGLKKKLGNICCDHPGMFVVRTMTKVLKAFNRFLLTDPYGSYSSYNHRIFDFYLTFRCYTDLFVLLVHDIKSLEIVIFRIIFSLLHF